MTHRSGTIMPVDFFVVKAGYRIEGDVFSFCYQGAIANLDGEHHPEIPMSFKRPVCNYSGVMKELVVGDSLPGNTIVAKEVPSGLINGVNCIFVLAYNLIEGSEMVFLNGVLQNAGAGNDYTISGQAVTFITAPVTGDIVLVTYWR